MFRFLHAADIHLDSPLRGLDRYPGAPVEEIRVATRRALENLVDTAVRIPVDCLLIAGDVYDGEQRDFNAALFLARQFARLAESGIPVVMISGNHDAANRMARTLELPANVRMLSPECPESVTGAEIGFRLADRDVVFHGQGFLSPAVDENVVLRYPPAVPGAFNIGLLHTSLDMEAGGEHARYAPCSVADLLGRGYDYWALGHVHQRRTVRAEPPIAYPGNLQGRHIRETGAKGCLLVTVDEARRPALEFLPMDVFRWERLKVSVAGAEDGEVVLRRVRSALERASAEHAAVPLGVRIVLEGRCPAHAELAAAPLMWTNQVRAAGFGSGASQVWIEKVEICTSLPAEKPPVEDGPLREVADYLREVRGDDRAVVELLGELQELVRRLPPEVWQTAAGESLGWEDPSCVRRLLDQVEPLLLHRLAPPGEDEA